MLATPSGPVLTPKGDRSQSLVLLSPSRTISESLTQLASSTASQLEQIWDEAGYSPEQRASVLSDLLGKFRDLCDAKIGDEQEIAEEFRKSIADSKEELKTTSKALKLLVDPKLLRETSSQTLADQLDTLTSALETVRATADAAKEDLIASRDFLIEAHEALGLAMDPSWRDVETDLTTERREEFHRKSDEMRDEVNSRTAAVVQLLQDCQQLMRDLRLDTQQDGSDLDKRIAGSLVRSKDGSYIMASKFRTDTCVGIASTVLDELTGRLAELSDEKRERKAKLQRMGSDIALLWEKLRIPEEEQRAFTESVQGLGIDTMQKGEDELHRLTDLKAKMLVDLVEEAKDTITGLWEETNTPEEQRQSFQPYHSTSPPDDDILDQLDDYVGVLQVRLEQMKPILRVIERREEILRERMEYEQLQKNPDRLKQRGAALTKGLMREEKMAKRIKRELPKLSENLETKLHEWKAEHGEDFYYHGDVYLSVMDRQEEEWVAYKEREAQLKLQKKQEERAAVENRFRPNLHHQHQHQTHHGIKKQRAQSRPRRPKPLGDATKRENRKQPSADAS